ncbi:MAG: helix-turn-helix domain containing protein [Planctomycetes bacterium]|nr:helix-turn-helix domain containing protein [Planctomycetota bacterium]
MLIDNKKIAKPAPDTLSNLQPDLSDEIKQKLEWFDYYEKHDRNARRTCRHFGISPDTFYRWKRRYNTKDHLSLVDNKRNRRPKKLRGPATPPQVVNRIRELKERYPTWGRNKLWILLKNEGIFISAATIGRIINRLLKSGQLRKSIINRIDEEKKPAVTRNTIKLFTGTKEYNTLRNVWKK